MTVAAHAAGAEFGDALPSRCQVIELHVRELDQLFNAIDPAPFRERDLDPKAETFIVEWAHELDHKRPIALVAHLDRQPASPEAAAILREAVHEHFKRQANSTRRKLKRLFSTGRTSLLIGLVALAISLVAVDLLAGMMDQSRFGGLFRESLVIGGWVAMWRPLEIFLYDWWPIRAEARLYDYLSTMPVRIVQTRTG